MPHRTALRNTLPIRHVHGALCAPVDLIFRKYSASALHSVRASQTLNKKKSFFVFHVAYRPRISNEVKNIFPGVVVLNLFVFTYWALLLNFAAGRYIGIRKRQCQPWSPKFEFWMHYAYAYNVPYLLPPTSTTEELIKIPFNRSNNKLNVNCPTTIFFWFVNCRASSDMTMPQRTSFE